MADWTSLLNGVNGAALAAFGREVTYCPQLGEPVPIRAVFQPTREAEESSPGVYGVLFISLSDLAQTPERGDQVAAFEAVYTVYDIEADGSGGAVLRLRQG
jgi:hypothetical protein